MPEPLGSPPSVARFAGDLASVTMGLDDLARRDGAAHLGPIRLVPLFAGEGLIAPRRYDDWAQARTDVDRLGDAAATVDDLPRRLFAQAMTVSLDAAVRLLTGEVLGFEAAVERLVGIDPAAGPISPERDALLAPIDAALARLGFGVGSMGARLAAWEDARWLAPEALPAVFAILAEEARRRTRAAIFDTGDYGMALTPVRGVTYTARCGFAERRMALNLDVRFTRAALKHLVAHEIFPGHATQMLSTRAAVEAGRAGPDALLCAANAATGCIQEGIGDQAVALVDWIEDDEDMLYAALKRLRNAEQSRAARRLMVERADEADVAADLRERAFGQDAWTAGRIAMARHPFHGPFIVSYQAGDEAVRAAREATPPEGWTAFVATLYGEAHGLSSFAAALAQDERRGRAA